MHFLLLQATFGMTITWKIIVKLLEDIEGKFSCKIGSEDILMCSENFIVEPHIKN